MHLKSLSARVLVLISGVLVLLAALTAAIAYTSHRSYAIEMQYDRASAFVERVLDAYPWIWDRYQADPARFGDLLRQFVLLEPDTGLYLLDPDGRVLATAGEGRIYWSTYKVDLKPLRAGMADDMRTPIMGDDPDSKVKDNVVAGRPIVRNGVERAWLYVVARGDVGELGVEPDRARAYALRAIGKIMLVTLAIGVLLSIVVVTMLTRPLGALTAATERIKLSGFAPREDGADLPDIGRPDEIGRLARTFRDAFARLQQEAQRALSNDIQRREMVASVSHDLRTPLTALIGQLDTIRIKGATLSEAERRHFFDGAWQNAGQLKRLTDSLADISRLDSPGITIQPEPTAVGELLDDIAQRYRNRAEQGGVALEVVYDSALPLGALDVGLIERAIGNLLDNALRVTPAGGRIELAACADADRLRLAVSDTGPGVPAQDQARVFDRFFQGSAARETRGSSGLGLAIVKRIAELHAGEVGLKNPPGGGASFWICVPLAST